MASSLHEVVTWTEQNGEVKAIDRLRVKVLPDLMSEGITLSTVNAETSCTPPLLKKVADAASSVVGRPCP